VTKPQDILLTPLRFPIHHHSFLFIQIAELSPRPGSAPASFVIFPPAALIWSIVLNTSCRAAPQHTHFHNALSAPVYKGWAKCSSSDVMQRIGRRA
jgi:hypothetical protein